MNKLKFTLLSFAVLLISFSSKAQYFCNSDEMNNKVLNASPAARAVQTQLENFTRQFVQDPANRSQSVIKVIPVVVHVLHQWGNENITDAQVQDAINILNRDFQKLNADTASVYSSFLGIIGNIGLEFRLAQLDPNGNCTNGIDRIVTPLTYSADDASKLNYWPCQSYLNIWTVASMANAGTAGYSYYPGNAPANKDGVIILHDYIGSIGTGSVGLSRALTHEVGHWLNLQHTWGSTNQPGVACGDDQVSDTPITKGFTSCPSPSGAQVCNPPIVENYQNYMDYSYCTKMFTNGQGSRMQAALNANVAGTQRNNLWTLANLQLTGTDGNLNVCVPIASFRDNARFLCVGGSTQFKDVSGNITFGSPVTRLWTFNGGTPATDTAGNPFVVYNNPGVYDVTLTVTSTAGSNTYTATGIVIVSPVPATSMIPFSEGFETLTFPGNDWFGFNTGGGNAWGIATTAAHTGTHSMRLYNYTGNSDGTDEFYLPAINCLNVTSPVVDFWLASAGRSNSSTDYLKVYLSINCGASWVIRYNKTGTALHTVPTLIGANFVPTASQWRNDNFTINQAVGHADIRLRYEFNFDNDNNIYIDDINITGIVGVEQVNLNPADVHMYPNPATKKATVGINLINQADIKLTVNDVLGQVVYQYSENNLQPSEYKFDIPLNMAKGIYFVRLLAGEQEVTQKLIVQ